MNHIFNVFINIYEYANKIICIGIPPFSNSLWVAVETMQFHIAHTNFLGHLRFAPMKKCPGVQGYLNLMPRYYKVMAEDRKKILKFGNQRQ